jgi:riboflavin kinase/FMN adenylyltransferase
MIILRSIPELASLPGPVVLAAGTFDGLHLGHQALIRHAMEEARRIHGTAVVMTFDRHPCALVRPDQCPRLLTTQSAKLRTLEGLGIPALLLLEFDEMLASLPPEKFIGEIDAAAHPLHMICVGSQWSFGKGGAGNIALLESFGKEMGFSVSQISPVEVGGVQVSSTRVRAAIAAGEFNDAEACLGRPFLLRGNVVRGAGLGSKIGFPTANLETLGMQLPPKGVYAVRVHHDGIITGGVMNIGYRPTVHDLHSDLSVEVHLFDWSQNLVGKELCIQCVGYLRGECKFPDLKALTMQILSDCMSAKQLLSVPSSK